jgi:glycosyltransferase involved in cell wall biosynthesis
MNKNKKNPKVSVCVVTYNQENYIEDCILSVLAQRFDLDLEILVGDDGSTDETINTGERICKEYPEVVKLYKHQVNLGASGNYQFLISRAVGDFIAHLDGDDFWLPGKLKMQVNFMKANEQCIAVYTNALVVDKNKFLLGVFNNKQPELQNIDYLLYSGNYPNHSSMLYRAEFKDLLLSIKENFIDYRIHCRLASKGLLGYLNSTLVVYRLGVETSMVSNVPDKVRERYWDALLEACRRSKLDAAAMHGVGNFLGQIFYSSLRRRRLNYSFEWLQRVRREVESDFYRIVLLATINLLIFMLIAIVSKLRNKLGCNRLKIFHSR